MPRTRRLRKKCSPQQLWTYVLLSSVAIVTITVLMAHSLSRNGGHDPETLCAVGVQPPRHVMVLLGLQESLTALQYDVIRSEILRLLETLQVGERLSLMALGPKNSGAVARVLFSKCRPRDGTDADGIRNNPKWLQKRYDERFKSPLEVAVQGLDAVGRADASVLLGHSERLSSCRRSGLCSSVN